uniref:NADH-ubiquinone oxidoreductase chain 4 n=1 Tax=Ptyodactylus guttatus TaxID=502503 RepID=A0A1Y1CC26_9SAUR|nr:NADH dehydrogenase subunit 4 [Ptyodactylus guttatus]BAX77906.1 NADH dehydrogenase subunit 4 [Ptyodactylus guttatus]
MLKLLFAMTMLIPTALLSPAKYLYTTITLYSTTLTLLTCKWLYQPLTLKMMAVNTWMFTDQISAPLIILSSWLLPLMIIASQHHMALDTLTRKRMFITTCVVLQLTLLLAFAASNLILFYIAFETTLLPTLILITRWGNQAERLIAGNYFLFYTLAGSLPLLIAMLTLYTHTTHMLLIPMSLLLQPYQPSSLMWLACLIAFFVKMPLYSLHLWLPKAHVEAPIAGSMILAAILLKLGGYGIIRLTPMFTNTPQNLHVPFIILALWGMIMTSLICFRQPDLKSIIAYSSVSHMGLVITGALLQTPWSIAGSMTLMIAHGLTSSMLFCLANTSYERTHTRTLNLTRGLHLMLPMMTLWWLIASLTNMALPPTINLLGELLVIVSTFNWTSTTIILTGTTTLLTATYTLYLFSTTQFTNPHTHTHLAPSHTREHLLMAMHAIPLILLITHPQLLY